jgi:hypothetical protein
MQSEDRPSRRKATIFFDIHRRVYPLEEWRVFPSHPKGIDFLNIKFPNDMCYFQFFYNKAPLDLT